MPSHEIVRSCEEKKGLVSEGLVVVKIGGAEGINLEAICADIAELHKLGQRFVLVHGGSARINQLLGQLGLVPEFSELTSGATTRYTPPETLEILTMAVCGMNKEIVTALQKLGVNAIGLSGIDGQLLMGKRSPVIRVTEGRKSVVKRDNCAGKLKKVNLFLLKLLSENGYLPVICPPIFSPEGAINVDADSIAARVAVCLGANKLLFLTNVPGILEDAKDESSLVPTINLATLGKITAKGRMVYKFAGISSALEGGVDQVVIADGRIGIADPVTRALMGEGTVVDKEGFVC